MLNWYCKYPRDHNFAGSVQRCVEVFHKSVVVVAELVL